MFRILITTAALALLTGSTAAKPVPCPVMPNTSTCFTDPATGDLTGWNHYTVQIGVTYANGYGCGAIEAALRAKMGGHIGNYHCTNDGYDNTVLEIYTFLPGDSVDVNSVLKASYPMVNADFTCTG
ncbi:hypothetical protein LTR17_000241 [Elasticomyces elasticus]|nr:hypothetical protein LTR17_000241 [Elasticomyces elasticus]